MDGRPGETGADLGGGVAPRARLERATYCLGGLRLRFPGLPTARSALRPACRDCAQDTAGYCCVGQATALEQLGAALVARSADQFPGWRDVVEFTACTAARIGETSGVRRADINPVTWTWNVRRQTTPGPGGLIDKGTKGNRARPVPIIAEIRPVVQRRLDVISDDPMARLFTGPRGGRISTAVLRDATHWDEVVAGLGYGFLRRHGLRQPA
jgi:hypothetical protein